jgi:glycosyltransferase involved in cell wall biosynthesis
MIELEKAGVRSICVCKPNSMIHEYLVARGIDCRSLPNFAKFSFASYRAVKHLIDEERVNVVHLHFHRDVWMPSLALRSRPKLGLYLSVYMGVPGKNDVLHRFAFSRVNAVFASSREFLKKLPTVYPIAPEKFHYLPYGRDLGRYKHDQAKVRAIRSKHNIAEGQIVVGTMVRIDPGKGVVDLVESFVLLEESLKAKITYLLVGEPTRRGSIAAGEQPFEPRCVEYENELHTYVKDHGWQDKIIFAGFQSDAIGYLDTMDVFVFPSRDELYSLAVLDAMGMERPVIASAAGGNLLQVEENVNGVFYELGDCEQLAARIAAYASNAELRAKHGKAGREFVDREHSMSGTINKLISFYKSE